MVVPLPRRLLTLSFELSTAHICRRLGRQNMPVINSTFNVAQKDSAAALSQHSLRPTQRTRSWLAAKPRQQCVAIPATATGVHNHSSESSPLTTNALATARVTRSARRCSSMAEPMTRFEPPRCTARRRQPTLPNARTCTAWVDRTPVEVVSDYVA